LAIRLGQARGTLDDTTVAELLEGLRALPQQIAEVRALESQIESLALTRYTARDALYVARRPALPDRARGRRSSKKRFSTFTPRAIRQAS